MKVFVDRVDLRIEPPAVRADASRRLRRLHQDLAVLDQDHATSPLDAMPARQHAGGNAEATDLLQQG